MDFCKETSKAIMSTVRYCMNVLMVCCQTTSEIMPRNKRSIFIYIVEFYFMIMAFIQNT